MFRAPLPPFTRETAAQKARMAEDAWNSCDPDRVSIGEDRVLHLNPSFTWPILIQAHMRIRTAHAPLRNVMTDIQFATALDNYCHGKHE
jgi:nuclear transport factor 2 (NTF2) superfamily protein